ncbi:MAG: DUF4395 domain-containing protein [Gammaproteobacteria bacterium]|nr:DUF4395 domain-containing protein [Gammaproteobacteria bacterium]
MSNYVDHAEIKLGQLIAIAISVYALLWQDVQSLYVLMLLFLLGGTIRQISPVSLVYRGVVSPLNIMRSDYRLDNIQPHKFGQLVGVLTVALALALIELEYSQVGWLIVGVLILLTLVSYIGWCIGCFMYYQLNRLGLRGFFRHTPTDKTVPVGSRPSKQAGSSD